MRSFYVRTLIWFLVTVLVTSGGVLLVSGNRPPEMGGAGPPMFLLASTQLAKARAEYESGGKAALEKHLRSLEEDWGVHGVMTDGEGRDLVTGADQSALMRRARRRPPMFRGLPMFQRGRPSFAAPSEDGKYWFIVRFPESVSERSSLLLPHEAWVIGSVALLCFLFARGVTSPVRKLRAAVQEFGQGNLTARADLKRGDEFGQLAEAFNQMAQRIANLLSSQRRLLADLSHEIRTPLTRLGLAVELARTGGDRPAALDRIQREADRLNELVGALLQLTRAESDTAAVRHERMSLTALADAVVDSCHMEAEARGGSVRLTSPVEPVLLEADPELLRRALENVIRNAIRFSDRVEVSVAAEGSQRLVRVRDHGPGVPEHELANLFEAFYRVREDFQTADGFGLGLAIAKRSIDLHGGTIEARNAQPGLEVEIRLPDSPATKPA